MNTRLKIIAFTFLFIAAAAVAGDDVATKHTLTLDGAKKAADAAVPTRKPTARPGSAIAIVDDGTFVTDFVGPLCRNGPEHTRFDRVLRRV